MYTRATQIYLCVVVGAGVIAIGMAAVALRVSDPAAATFLTALALVASALKIEVPGVDGNISLNFVPIVLSTNLLSLPEAILLTAAAAVVQSTAFVKKFNAVRGAFNCGALAVSVALAGLASSYLADKSPLIQMALSACVYYVVNSALVTIVAGLAGGKPMAGVWNDCLSLYLPYFAAGIACAMATVSGVTVDFNRRVVQSPGFILLPSMLLVRQYFKVASLRAAR